MIWTPKPKPDPYEWTPVFALFPVTLLDGRKAWLQTVQMRLVTGALGLSVEFTL
jgi:hypothetical protein